MNDPELPKWIFKLLRSFCPPALAEEIEGDLIQSFTRDVKRLGVPRSRRKLIWAALRFFRPGILFRNSFSLDLGSVSMLSNYLKVALRVMSRNKAFTLINVSGLAIGLMGALLLSLWITQELSFEQFHADKNRLYMAWNRAIENGQVNCWVTTPRILAPTLKAEYPFIEASVSYAYWDVAHLFVVGEKRLLKTTGAFTDPEFLTMLSFPFLKGDPHKALQDPTSIVLTNKFARELFEDQDPLGQVLTISQSGHSFEFTVSGILKDLPATTRFQFDYLISFGFLEGLGEKDTYWGNNSVTTLVRIKEDSDPGAVNDAIRDVEKRHYPEGQHIEIFLYPLTKMHLYSKFENGVPSGGRIEVVRMQALLGICLVVIACINFINLSTARGQRRSKEVAVRKVTGAVRFSLVVQFLCEAILVSVGAGVIAFGTAYLALPYFNILIGQRLMLDTMNVNFWLAFGILVALIGFLAGGYPALYLSSFRPVQILKGARVWISSRSGLRNLLVTFQFGVAVTLVVSVIVIRQQIIHVQNRDTGYSKDNLVYVPLTGDLDKNYMAFRNDLLESGVAVSVTKTSARLTEQWSSTTSIQWMGKDPSDKTDFERFYIDGHIASTAGLTIVKGRDLDLQRFATDSAGALLNETAAEKMGFENPIGESVSDDGRKFQVVGVVRDFVLTSPFHQVEPIILFNGNQLHWAFNVVYIKLNEARATQANIEQLSQTYAQYNPEYPFEYHFADIEYEQKFSNLQTTLTITTVFSTLAIFIACLGLLGLSTYMTEARVKEIGIRKVMGGTVLGITQLLSYATLKPILLAIMLFTPVAWLCMDWWLESFDYRVPLDAWIFLLAALSIVSIALVTVGVNTIRAAKANPVHSLRNE